ncbi:MAG: membrane-bound lytic murein transglycosylase MltF [Gammaproteobacteria bacterium]|nr:membrane-bound lytic murein transglycosylase MltF [Gammaproteobacteria bacterium]MCP4088928.1 membrane-bound lytic murein transglycosylase MltF [Gammaproteobacteria bacterium]MCP4274944.1 membrane-bound lytic murein transglycosylase MltF [Gammaproteobacteria bacterium]MCP4831989.1 membrane-bound lytic murein transglycosylase MltF [Gammaproteobacteria bacterium]MCP4929424.1 membrane-bound lytic murein transglycosylase MltF [Gammaproteobacteria bacterium]
MRKAAIILFALALGTCSRPPTTLEEVLSSGQLRVITRNSPTTYYHGALGEDGPEFQLTQGFANFLSKKYGRVIKVDFIPVDQFAELLPALKRGYAHLGAAGLTVTEERKQQVAFGPVYQTVRQELVYRLNSGKPRSIKDLHGKQLEIMAGSSYVNTLHDIKQLHPELAWAENTETEISELLVAVEEQEIDYTVVDSNDFAVHRAYMPDLRVAMTLKEEDQLAWAFGLHRSQDIQTEVKDYFDSIKTSGELEQILDRYYGHTNRFDYVGTRTFIKHYKSRLKPYELSFQTAGLNTETDWRLLAAIGYQESHWNPDAISPTGVRGLMMLTKVTASTVGVADRQDPHEAIPGGARYLAELRNRLTNIPEPDKSWFALAAYNVGYGHVQDARAITKQRGADPNRWLDVKEDLPLLAIRKWYSQAPHGYARGWEPVQYVSNVRTYYEILNWLTQDEQAQGKAEEKTDKQPQVGVSLQTADGASLLNWL